MVAGLRLLVTGGAVFMDIGCVLVNTVELCTLGEDGLLTCAFLIVDGATLFRERMDYCSICLDEILGKVCDRVFVYGGVTDDSFGEVVVEVYDGVQFSLIEWGDQFVWSGALLNSECIRFGQRLYLLGGTSDGKQGLDVLVMILLVSMVNVGVLVAS